MSEYWNEEGLANHEASAREAAKTNDLLLGDADLYRLARLGLAAEQVKDLLSADHQDLSAAEFTQAQRFFSHPAWRAK